MRKLLIIILLAISLQHSFAQTKVMYALLGGISAEQKYVEIFIAGYESAGGVWTGESDTVTLNTNNEFISLALPLALSNGSDLVITNTAVAFAPATISKEFQIDPYYNQGIQSVIPSGTNNYHAYSHPDRFTNVITVSAGDTIGQTGYYAEFFNEPPYGEYPITAISQGTNDTATVTLNISVNGGFVLYPVAAVVFDDVVGFSSSPDGLHFVVKFVSDGGYNKFKIIHNLGTGSFVSGTAKLFFESYAVPYTAGMLAFIRDSLDCSWWEARYRMRMTASGEGSTSQFDGYGKPDVLAAINYSGDIPSDPYDVLGSIGNITGSRIQDEVRITIDSVGNALNYYVYDRSELLGTYAGHGNLIFSVNRSIRKQPHEFWYRATRGSQETSESSKVKIPYNKYSRVKIR